MRVSVIVMGEGECVRVGVGGCGWECEDELQRESRFNVKISPGCYI